LLAETLKFKPLPESRHFSRGSDSLPPRPDLGPWCPQPHHSLRRDPHPATSLPGRCRCKISIMASRSRPRCATPDLVTRPRERRRDTSSPPLHCCCGSDECVLLRRNCSILESVEKDVHTAAQLGQVRPDSLVCHALRTILSYTGHNSTKYSFLAASTTANWAIGMALLWSLGHQTSPSTTQPHSSAYVALPYLCFGP
jgi:hypothetical protein